ncbi:uncharacterized protein AB675_9770 [Cyphellophora attinorum]|uniref:Uncharacterized protein n=1 Tax=Cyphellophora attinorum TaxID=1664694 RepID=A0A0N1HX90_9EURO|nr:uncharacterized protein AB675_9770 [Phialophora attinorum]KPI42516.1 hypothetical protein AB675_9770 [Phialophora attinorum]
MPTRFDMTATPPPSKSSSRSRHMLQYGIKKRAKSPAHPSVSRSTTSSAAALDEYTRSMQHYLDHTDFKLEADHSSREGSPERVALTATQTMKILLAWRTASINSMSTTRTHHSITNTQTVGTE